MDLFTALQTRSSAARLAEPGPSPEDLDHLLQAAAHAPDHGRLKPWRLIVLQGATREAFTVAAAEAAIAEAKKNNWHMAIAIVGPEGELIYFEKMDGTQSSSVALAQAKARTSALFRRPSKAFADQFAAGNTGFMSFPDEARPIASEGGIPIIFNGKLIGAIGASGGTGPQDGVAATAGANAVK